MRKMPKLNTKWAQVLLIAILHLRNKLHNVINICIKLFKPLITLIA